MRLLCALLLLANVAGAQPTYSAETIVNAASGRPGRLSPNGHATIFGTRLTTGNARSAVMVGRTAAIVLYASPTQINFVIPPGSADPRDLFLVQGSERHHVVRLELLREAPELYTFPEDFAAATHVDGQLVSAQAPARPGQIVILYGTGMGPTRDGQAETNLPATRADRLATPLDIWLDGQLLPQSQILYAGVAPTFAGLYQINLRLPDTVLTDPFLQVGFRREPSSRTGVRLMVRPRTE
jgi:uncharacterized protein (TIGR03437 family)